MSSVKNIPQGCTSPACKLGYLMSFWITYMDGRNWFRGPRPHLWETGVKVLPGLGARIRISGLRRLQLHWVLHSGSKLAVPSRGKDPIFSLGSWLGSLGCYSSHGSLFFFRFFWNRKHHVVSLHLESCENNAKRKWASKWKWGNNWKDWVSEVTP